MKVLVVFFYGLICLQVRKKWYRCLIIYLVFFQHFCHGVKFATMEIALRIDHSSWFYRDLYNMVSIHRYCTKVLKKNDSQQDMCAWVVSDVRYKLLRRSFISVKQSYKVLNINFNEDLTLSAS